MSFMKQAHVHIFADIYPQNDANKTVCRRKVGTGMVADVSELKRNKTPREERKEQG
jgi:hypothetical protein